MGSTTVHIPDTTLARIDAIAGRRGVSRNRIVLEALEDKIAGDAGEWPVPFFELPDDPDDKLLLCEAVTELETFVLSARRNRGAPLF